MAKTNRFASGDLVSGKKLRCFAMERYAWLCRVNAT